MIKMPRIRLDELGNFQEHYHPISHHVKFEGHVQGWEVNPTLVLKLYSLFVGQPFTEKRTENIKRLLYNHISCAKIDPFSGLGFAVHSEDTLNIARWDTDIPHLLRNNVHHLKGKDRDEPTIHKADMNTEGAFCAWELFIAQHERDAWLKFLNSQRSDDDKRTYLHDVIQGQLRPRL